jgi:hypothetical protein
MGSVESSAKAPPSGKIELGDDTVARGRSARGTSLSTTSSEKEAAVYCMRAVGRAYPHPHVSPFATPLRRT